MTFIARTTMSLLVLAMMATSAGAQRVSGTVTDESGKPVMSAIVSVFSGKDTASVTLTRADGTFQLTFPRRDLTLLVRAIGLQPVRIPLRSGSDTTVSIQMSRIAFRLAAVRVNEFTSCAKTQTGTADIVDVWVEVTQALENTRLVRNSKKRTYKYVLYQHLTDAMTGVSRQLQDDTGSWTATRPFTVASPKELASRGYVIDDGRTSRLSRNNSPGLFYRAPDEMVLLDASFQTTHCFWASHGEDANEGMIGVHFMPISGIKINDIRGTFWIDSSSYELKRLDYIYEQTAPPPPPPPRNNRAATAAPDPAPADSIAPRRATPGLANPDPGGILEFNRLADGSFIIVYWRIFLNDTWVRQSAPGQQLKPPRMLHETGGMVLSVSGG